MFAGFTFPKMREKEILVCYILGGDWRKEIRMYWDRKWYPESFYLLAMADYLCRENVLPVCQDYDDIRKYKLAEPIYPRDIMVAVWLRNKRMGMNGRDNRNLVEAKWI